MDRKVTFLTIIVAVLFTSAASLKADPMTAQDARLAVTGWLKTDPDPLGTPLGHTVDRVETFTNNAGEVVYYIVYVDPAGFVIVSSDDRI